MDKTKLTSCKTCSKEVARSATVCPHCGEKLKTDQIEWLLLVIIVYLTIFFWMKLNGH
jgi:RNA polymerase subunit RPABC4/transcription elongation factor Spt4